MLHVGVDAWNLPGDHRGIGRYVRALLESWAEHDAERVAISLIVPEWHSWTVAARYRREAAGRRYRVLSRRFHRRARLDLLWFPFNGPSWTAFDAPAVATLHDASPFLFEPRDPALQATFVTAAQRCRHILTDSGFSKRELARVLQLPEERITAIPLGVGPPLNRQPAALDAGAFGRFALFVGEPEPRKGLDTLVEALVHLHREGFDVPLVVAGAATQALPSRADVRLQGLGHVDDATLAALYRACAVFVYPSRYEGFGLPVLEAMSYGAPVVASRAPAIPEAGGDAAAYVPPDDALALAGQIRRVLCEPGVAADLRRRGLARAQAMPWRTTAEHTLAVFEAIAGSGERNGGSPLT